LAGIAGCALTLLGSIGPTLGTNYIVDTFMVVVLAVSEELSAQWPEQQRSESEIRLSNIYQRLFGKGTCISCGYSLSSMEASGFFSVSSRVLDE